MKGSFAHKNIYSIKPNWRGGGDDVSSQQSVVRDRCAWETCSSQEVPKHWLSVGQWEKSFYLMTRKRLSQRTPVNTDEINELAQGRKLSRQVMSPPLHLYNTVRKTGRTRPEKTYWRGGDEHGVSRLAVRSQYAQMFEHYWVGAVLQVITANLRDKVYCAINLIQRASVNTDEINAVVLSDNYADLDNSPPLHLYNINTYLNKKSVLIVLLCKEGSKQ